MKLCAYVVKAKDKNVCYLSIQKNPIQTGANTSFFYLNTYLININVPLTSITDTNKMYVKRVRYVSINKLNTLANTAGT